MLGGILIVKPGFFGVEKASGILGGPEISPINQHIVNDFGSLESKNMRQDGVDGEVLGVWADGAVVSQIPPAKPMDLSSGTLGKKGKFFSLPATGLNWGKLHEENGVDISNSCGTPVLAAAEGVVVMDPSVRLNDWSGGYGKFVLIEHMNGTKTRYAHLNKILVEPGELISDKQKIGTMGNTGKVNDKGCHLHFEVLGGENPFAKN